MEEKNEKIFCENMFKNYIHKDKLTWQPEVSLVQVRKRIKNTTMLYKTVTPYLPTLIPQKLSKPEQESEKCEIQRLCSGFLKK